MKKIVSRLLGAQRPKVIAVFGVTRAEVETGVRHALTGTSNLPIWAWCAEKNPEPVAGCERLTSGVESFRFPCNLGSIWPALSIVAWTGSRGTMGLKLWAFTVPPFRVVLFNEADGFFPARPGLIAKHLNRRLRNAFLGIVRSARDWAAGAAHWLTTGLAHEIRSGLSWLWQSLLALLAFSAEWTAPLSRDAVAHAPRGRAPAIEFEEMDVGTFCEVAIPNRSWPRRAILHAASQSTAEFLVLRMRGEQSSAAPLIAAARRTKAFAVARQVAHSAWRKRAVPKHPFRRLQEGEVSEVFAPFSSLLVLRRETVVRLGIPRALTYGGALMILFWKASAAGLRSLALGHGGTVPDESAMALEDAELALRLTMSRDLAALGPARPSRYRGNVAWSPFHSRPFRDKRRVLVVSPYLPFPLSHGGAVRIYNLCRSLADQVDFVLACFREAGEAVAYDELHRVFREVYVVDADEKHADVSVPKQVAEYRNAAMSDLIRGFCLDLRVDLVQLEYTQLAEYRDDTGAIPVVLVEHDITFTLYQQLADFTGKAQARQDYQLWLEFERTALQCSNEVWTMSGAEQAIAVDHGAPRRRTRVVPNGVDLDRFTPASKPAGPPGILFVGSFRHLPNLLAFEFLRRSVMPEVWQACPDAVLHVIAGPDHERHAGRREGGAALLASDPRIVIEGFVEDVRPAYRAADVVAIPLPVSAGTNIKLMEAMACGRAVVSTPAGCRGLELTSGLELIEAPLDSAFAAALIELLRDENLRTQIAWEARRTAERRFGWDAIARDAMASYEEFAGASATALVSQA